MIGIEENASAVADGRENLLLNGIQNYRMLHGDVGTVLTGLMAEKDFERPDLIVVDPPRSGLDALAIGQILSLRPKTLLYISCNPQTQIENIKNIQSFYRLLEIQPIDQFPHTPHMERCFTRENLACF